MTMDMKTVHPERRMMMQTPWTRHREVHFRPAILRRGRRCKRVRHWAPTNTGKQETSTEVQDTAAMIVLVSSILVLALVFFLTVWASILLIQ